MSRLIVPPIETPSLPLIAEIPGGAKVGLIIRIQGNVPGNAHRFSVNLACGPFADTPSMSDIAMHLNPRFDKGYVARNTYADGIWGNEEGQFPSHLPMARERAFEMMLLFEPQQYKVAVDGAHFLEYNHRIPMSAVNTLQIMGDVELFRVEFLDNEPPPPVPSYGYENFQVFQPVEIFNPDVPFALSLVGGLPIGRTITITGRPKPYATRFSINLERESSGMEGDIFFHMNPRFGGLGDERDSVIVRNSRLGSVWGSEERDTSYFPFNHGFNFDLTILCERLHFLVAVNGQHLVTFRHREAFELVDLLTVSGEVDLILVKVH